jgi:hypothetical protein
MTVIFKPSEKETCKGSFTPGSKGAANCLVLFVCVLGFSSSYGFFVLKVGLYFSFAPSILRLRQFKIMTAILYALVVPVKT